MGSVDEERAQVMILRAWVEDGHRLRVRVTQVTQDQAREPVQGAASTIDGVCALVRTWLGGLLDDADCHARSAQGNGNSGVTDG
jgi:hypothetical protein